MDKTSYFLNTSLKILGLTSHLTYFLLATIIRRLGSWDTLKLGQIPL